MPDTHHLAVLAEECFRRTGDHDALWFEGRVWRHSELLERGRRTAGGLRRIGVTPGDRVVVLMANCPEVGISYQAIWRAGAVVTPVVFLVTEAELRHILSDSDAVAVVTTPEFVPKVLEAAAGAPALRHVVVAGGWDGDVPDGLTLWDFQAVEEDAPAGIVDRSDDDLAALLYTGGTTGRAKGVMLSHRNLWWSAKGMHDAAYAENATRTLVPLPLSHAYGLVVTVAGLHTDEPGFSALMRWFDPTGCLQLIEQHGLQRATLVPAMIQMLLSQPLEDRDLSSLRFVGSGGAPLARETLEEFERRVPGAQITEGYGLTETAAVISITPPGRRRPGSVGLPIPGLELRILDDDGKEVPPGTDGEICVRSPGVMRGYWRADDKSAAALEDGWLHTGDIGHVDEDGYLYVVDRKKDLIIRGGFNVFPRDVEDVLVEHPAVAIAGCVGRPDPRLGEEVVGFVSLRPGASATPDELMAFARERLAANKYPREIHVVDTVPLTSVGKLDRKALRARVRTD